MTVMSLPSSVPDFDGKICHIINKIEKGTLIFVRPLTWSQKYDEISSKIQELTSTLKKVDYLSGVNLGEVYLVKLNSSIERSYFIRRPKPNAYSIYLIDKGMQCDIHCGEIYECPSQIMKFELFSCVCPVLVPSIQPMDIYNSLVEHNCKCIVETVSKSAVVVGFVRGQLQVEVNERYENLSDIVARMTNDCSENSGNIAGIKVDISSSSSDTTTYTSYDETDSLENYYGKYARKPNKKKNNADPAAVDVGRRHEMPKIRNLFIQTAFKHYEPEMLPITVNVRFDKKDRFWDTFWVVNTKIFSVVQTLLKESENKISYFPILSHQSSNIWMRQTPCLVRIKGDYTLRGLHRAVPAKYDTYTKKFSIFLVDYGWFRWVSESDIIDISTLDKFDPIKNLPAAMIHCRKSSFSTLHIEDLNKGDNCSIVIKNGAERGIYTVDLFKFRSEETSIVNDGQIVANSAKSIVMFPRPENLVAETSQQQLIASVMMARRDWAHQHTNLWYDSIKCPALMLIPMPIVMPVLLPNSDLTKNQCNNNADFRNEIRTGIHYLNSPKNIHFGNYKPEGRSDMRYINDNRASRFLERASSSNRWSSDFQAASNSNFTRANNSRSQYSANHENGQLRDVSSESGKQNSTCRKNNSKI